MNPDINLQSVSPQPPQQSSKRTFPWQAIRVTALAISALSIALIVGVLILSELISGDFSDEYDGELLLFEVEYPFSNEGRFCQSTIVQINQDFFRADVHIEDPDRGEPSPVVTRDGTTSIFTDDFFNISIVVPGVERPNELLVSDYADSWSLYSWFGYSISEHYHVSVLSSKSSGSSSVQEMIAGRVAIDGLHRIILESGVLVINGEEYVYVRYHEAGNPNRHLLEIGRKINNAQFTAQWTIRDTSISTESLFEPQ